MVVNPRRILVAVALLVALLAAPCTSAAADSAPPATTTVVSALPIPSGIELPNSGTPPQFSGDRGGWAQLTLFALVTAGMLAIFIRIAYSTRQRTKARRLASDT